MTGTREQSPESLATFAGTARQGGRKPADIGVAANHNTAPMPTDPKRKDRAATKVLQEGVTGKDRGAEAAINELPDRIVESRD